MKLKLKYYWKLAIEQITKKIVQWLSEGSGWIIESVNKHYLNIAKYNPMKGSSYIQFSKELRNPLKGLVNMKNKDVSVGVISGSWILRSRYTSIKDQEVG